MPTSTPSISPPDASPESVPSREISTPYALSLPRRSPRKRRFLLVLAICFAWLLVESASSWLVQHTRLRASLNNRLQAALGRPVEVARYSVNLRGIPALEAHSVTVAEDPRFGHEYFLYADSITLKVRWLPLFIGRLELGSIFISNPSLNLVRSKDGRWNIEEWLPAPPGLFPDSTAPLHNSATQRVPSVRSIGVTGGRINFKRGDEKSAFSLIDLSGSVERLNAGKWWLDLTASPARAAVVLQQAGTIHVHGEVGGTSSRLRPADVQLTWQDAALADLLRLASAYDHGIRGTFSAALSAHTQGALWNLSGRAELRRLHRWDLSMRPDNPALNLLIAGDWLPEASAVNISAAALETPRSRITATGAFTWDPNTNLADENLLQDFSITSTAIDGADLLAWLRAFVPGISNDLILKGGLAGDLTFRGTPPAPVAGAIFANNLSLEGGSLRSPISSSDARLAFAPENFRLAPSSIDIGVAGGALRVEGSCASGGPICQAKLSGRALDVEDLTSAASAVGWNWPAGWHIEGPATFDLQWLFLGHDTNLASNQETRGATGKISFQDLSLRAPFLNQPVTKMKGRIDLAPTGAQLTLSSASAFGGNWSGSLDLVPHAGERHFSLAVDRLNSEDLDRWLNPRWRQGFLQNVLPFLNSTRRPALSAFLAQGHLSVNEFAFTRYTINRLQGELVLDGPVLELRNADASSYGGKLQGDLRADFSSSPSYRINARFNGLDLASLTAGSPIFSGIFGGTSSGNLLLEFTGAGRQELASSLRCEGAAEIQNASWKGLDLLASLREAEARPGNSSAVDVAARYACANRRIEVSDLRIAAPGETLLASGTVDGNRSLDFRLTRITRLAPSSAKSAPDTDQPATSPASGFLLQGPLLHPTISATPSPFQPPPSLTTEPTQRP